RRSYPVAIKVMHADLAEDLEFVRRFRQEADNLAALAHDNIVRFYSLERDGLLTFLVMDYVDGITLRTLLAQTDGPLPLSQVAHIFPQLCQALHYAHEEGFIHRDVKPANIMLQPDGRLLVTDFGIAKATDAATITSYMQGTPAYMSPEQCRGEMPDRRSDVYALGIVLYEMVTGRRPFAGQTEAATGSTREKVRWEQLYASPPSPRSFNTRISAELEQVILKAMAKQPEDRFSTALGMLEAFEVTLGPGLTKEAPPVVTDTAPFSPGTVSPLPPASESETALTTTFRRLMQTAQAYPIVAAIAVVIALAVFGWLLSSLIIIPPTPTVTLSPTSSPTAVNTPMPERRVATILEDTDAHEGPGTEYADFARLPKGTQVDVTGRNQKGTWWRIIHPEGPDRWGWVDADKAEMDDPRDVPVVSTPTPKPTSTYTPIPTPTPTSTPVVITKVWKTQDDFINRATHSDGVDRYDARGGLQLLSLNDTFNANVLNPDRWISVPGYPTPVIRNQRLEHPHSGVTSRVQLTGPWLADDFELKVDYTLTRRDLGECPRLAIVAMCQADNQALIQFIVNDSGCEDQLRYGIEAWLRNPDKSVRRDDYTTNPSWDSGSLQIARQGTTWTLSYKIGGDRVYVPLVTRDEEDIGGRAFGPCSLMLTNSGWQSSGAFTSYFDNLEIIENHGNRNWTYVSSGTWSTEVDGGADGVNWQELTWDRGSQPAGTEVAFEVRSCPRAGGRGACSPWQPVIMEVGERFNLVELDYLGDHRYLQVRVELNSNMDNNATPRIDQFSLGYWVK
ncbi:MAG: protein kinase, partial [Anaerolineales bacterium]